ncbi:RICIN domain-containing protein [Streptomyces sp. NPDC002742]|uniref:RICIN domain-containing protein n=1 Tax=unclassified Streptomyces TaxID=2593676 RepID=UPI0034372E88
MRRRRTILLTALTALTAFFSSVTVLAPGQAQADVWHPSTYLTNKASGLDARLESNTCQNMPCLNGKGFVLSGRGDTVNLVDVPGGSEIRWSSDKCLDAKGSANGTPVVLADCDGTTSQLWTIEGFYGSGADLGAYLLVHRGSGRCLDAGNPAFPTPPPTGARLQIWDCISKPNAPWHVNQDWAIHF